MSILYRELALIYDDMYQSLFDYDAEAAFYTAQLRAQGARRILEIGCGTGHLATRLLAAGFDYKGMDLSTDMLALAAKNLAKAGYTEGGYCVEGNMCAFNLAEAFDAVLITGRSISYLTKIEDVTSCFSHIYTHLKPQGCLLFDAIDAAELFKSFESGAQIQHLETQGQSAFYKRTSTNTPQTDGRTWRWQATYYTRQAPTEAWSPIGSDDTFLRAFTTEDLSQCLPPLTIEAIYPKETYTWKDAYILARRP